MASLPRCGAGANPKVRYPTQMAAINRALRSSKKRGVALRTYKCPTCGGYHLTRLREFRPAVDIRNEGGSAA